jgi:hypothetical protein
MDYRFDLKAIELISSRDLLRKWTTLKQEENTRHVEESSYNSTYSLHFASYRPIQAFEFEIFNQSKSRVNDIGLYGKW